MKNRSIEKVVFAQEHAMGDMYVKQPLPSRQVDYLDPFVLLHHAKYDIEEGHPLEFAGVGPHPHRGFAPVTFVFEGGVSHQDSRGNHGTVYKGGVQWMNAGMGIIHSERPAMTGPQEIIQMWVNTPSRNKMDQPSYYPLAAEESGNFVSADQLVKVSVASGELLGIKGAIPTLSPVNSAMIWGQKGGSLNVPVDENHNAFLYLLGGKIRICGQVVNKHHMVVFANDGEGFELEILEDAKALLMSGEPIGEEIVSQGPFVMNSQVEIMEAYRDFRKGKMGILIE
jgi:redox-sensitive bicupin YhaK (pirin superfamily)